MNKETEDLLLNIVGQWNPAVGRPLAEAVTQYRNSVYYRRRDDKKFNDDMAALLDRIGVEIDKRPQAAKQLVARAKKLLEQPLRAAS